MGGRRVCWLLAVERKGPEMGLPGGEELLAGKYHRESCLSDVRVSKKGPDRYRGRRSVSIDGIGG